MAQTEGTGNDGTEYVKIDISELVDGIMEEMKAEDETGEVSEFIQHMEENMHEGEMTEETALTIVKTFCIAYSLIGSNTMRIDLGLALKELTETNSQHTVLFAKGAEDILAVTIHKLLRQQ